jgi:4-amino-4-deoxy-L-arabinose transferase-like glycosyltransferase
VTRWGTAALALAAALLSVLLRFPFLSVPLTADEAGYAYVATWLARGQALYRDLWFDRPQGIFLIYGAILALFGEETEAIRLAAGIYNALTTLLVFLLGRRLVGTNGALAAAFLFALASSSPGIEGFTANGELFMNLPACAALLLALQRRYVLAGALLAVAALVKPTALPGAAAAVGLVVWTQATAVRARLTGAAWVALGSLLVTAPFVWHGVVSGPDDFWYAVVGFRVEEHSALSAGAQFFDELRQSGPHVTWAVFPVWLLVALWVRRGHWRTSSGRILAAFLVGSVAGAAAGGYWYWHYFVGILPPAALMAGQALAQDLLPGFGARLASLVRAPRRLLRPRRALAWLVAAALSGVISLAANASYVGATPEETGLRLYRRHAASASRDVARYLEARTAPDDTVYAAFAGPEVYFMSRRRSAGRHLYWTEINRVPGALDDVIRTLDDPRKCPKYVVRLQSELERPGRAAAFWDRVERRFAPEAVVRGVIIYRRIDG